MTVETFRVSSVDHRYETSGPLMFIDITSDVLADVAASGVRTGQCAVFSHHTTAAVIINEHEPLLLRDIARLLRTLVPATAHYDHNDFTTRTVNMTPDECRNGHAHLQHLLLGGSLVVPVVNGAPVLGEWQSLFLVELDHPRIRHVTTSTMGVG